MRKSVSGFTIVELLVVIVVIAILATITTQAYIGMQVRSRDAARSDTIAKIERALELYRLDYDRYPSATASPGESGWEVSTDTAGTFMEYLSNYGLNGGTPVDPLNVSPNRFMYYRYAAGHGGCPVEKGGFYVLRAYFESASNKPTTGQGITCPSYSQTNSGTHYVNSRYENE